MDRHEGIVAGWRKYLLIEPVIFCVIFALSVSNNVMTDMIIFQTCRSLKAENKSECDILHKNSSSEDAIHLQEMVQPHANLFFILQTFADTIFPTISSFYIGPWSDKYGRKPILNLSLIGFFFGYIIFTILSYLDVTPYWFLLASVPPALFGGYSAIIMSCSCYVTDISTPESRSWHLAWLDSAFLAGSLAGLLSSPVLFNNYGYPQVFAVSAGILLFSWFYSFFCVPETIVYEDRPFLLKSIFDNSLIKQLFKAAFKEREEFDKFTVWWSIICIALHIVIIEGSASVMYMFTIARLGWNITDYSIYSATFLTVNMIGALLTIKFIISLLGLPDTVCIIVACLSIFGNSMTKAFTLHPWQLFLGAGIGMFSGASVPILRSIISKSVPQQDIGKIFSVITSMEMIVPLAITPLYVLIYTKFLPPLYPSPVWYIPAVLSLIIIIITFVIQRRLSMQSEMQYVPCIPEIN